MVAAGLPLVLAMSGVIVTFGVLGAASRFTEFNLFVPNIASMIGLGVGIDYALFIVNRYREELVRGNQSQAAVTTTTATAGRTVFFSGLTVLLSLAGLLLVEARIFRELALGAMTAVAVMVLGALSLVPALLSWLGPRVNAVRVPGRSQQSVSFGGDRFWRRWARISCGSRGSGRRWRSSSCWHSRRRSPASIWRSRRERAISPSNRPG